MRPRLLFALLALGLAAAAEVRAQTPDDPYEKLNRRFYASAMDVDKRYFLPASRLYRSLAPGVVGLAIHNFVTNLSEPVVVGNDILQLRLRRAADDFARLVTNTTFGIGGLIDVAKRQGLPHRDNDFGVTLGRLGVRPGPYLFLPFLGPSDMRDAIGMGVDAIASPLNWVRFPGRIPLDVTTTITGALDSRLRAQGDLEAEIGGATDPYATIRSDYLQSREAMIRGEEAAPELPPLDDPAPAAPAAAGGPSPDASPSPSAAASPSSAPLAAADAVATAPGATADNLAAADDLADVAMATAQPCDRDLTAVTTRLAGL